MAVPHIDMSAVHSLINQTKSLLEAKDSNKDSSYFGFLVEGILLVSRKQWALIWRRFYPFTYGGVLKNQKLKVIVNFF